MLAELRWADALDILVVAALLYGLTAWLRRSHGALVAAGVGLVSTLYLGARVLDLELTTRVFQSLFAVSLLVLVVVFQEEIRQAFEELAGWAFRRRTRAHPRLDMREVLVRALFDLARDKVGALIVIPGSRPLERHLQGGEELDGVLSVALLRSLFDPHSDGHDGAVLFESRRVTRFGVHLPLARSALPGVFGGTRHRAALGLAERTDALCLVVSEERGAVSVALDGQLREIRTPGGLASLLDRYFRERHPIAQRRPLLARLFLDHWVQKASALAAAALLWAVFVPGARPIERVLSVPVVLRDLPSGLAVDAVVPAEVEVALIGPRRELLFVDADDLRIEIDASLAALGRRTFEVSGANIVAPGSLSATGVSPERIQISVRESAAR